jgi:TonB family protein
MSVFIASIRVTGRVAWLIGLFAIALSTEAQTESESKFDQPPKIVQSVAPEYPFNMRLMEGKGEVLLEVLVNVQGRVEDAWAVESTNPWLERAAITAIEKWQFTPASKGSNPVPAVVQQLMTFQVQGGSYGDGRDLVTFRKGKDHAKLPAAFQWETPPKAIYVNFPVYPFELLKAGVRGKASIAYIVGPDGLVQKSEIKEAGHPEIGLAMQAMIETWRFEPAQNKAGQRCFAMLAFEQAFVPRGRGFVPISDEARRILRDLERGGEGISTARQLDAALEPRVMRAPVYPTALREQGPAGEALIEFFVDQNGDAQLPRIVSATATEFGYAAAQAVATWRFKKPLRDGKPTVVRVQVPVQFAARG